MHKDDDILASAKINGKEVFSDEIMIISQALAFRVGTIIDLDEITELLNSAYAVEISGEESFRQAPGVNKERVMELLQPNSGYDWMVCEAPNGRGVEADGVILAACCFSTDGASKKNGQAEGYVGAVRYFGVLPRFQRVLIATRLLKRVESAMQKRQCIRMMVCVPDSRSSLFDWLERRGFHCVARTAYPTHSSVGHTLTEAGADTQLLIFQKPITQLTNHSSSSSDTIPSSSAVDEEEGADNDVKSIDLTPPKTSKGKMHLPPHWRQAEL